MWHLPIKKRFRFNENGVSVPPAVNKTDGDRTADLLNSSPMIPTGQSVDSTTVEASQSVTRMSPVYQPQVFRARLVEGHLVWDESGCMRVTINIPNECQGGSKCPYHTALDLSVTGQAPQPETQPTGIITAALTPRVTQEAPQPDTQPTGDITAALDLSVTGQAPQPETQPIGDITAAPPPRVTQEAPQFPHLNLTSTDNTRHCPLDLTLMASSSSYRESAQPLDVQKPTEIPPTFEDLAGFADIISRPPNQTPVVPQSSKTPQDQLVLSSLAQLSPIPLLQLRQDRKVQQLLLPRASSTTPQTFWCHQCCKQFDKAKNYRRHMLSAAAVTDIKISNLTFTSKNLSSGGKSFIDKPRHSSNSNDVTSDNANNFPDQQSNIPDKTIMPVNPCFSKNHQMPPSGNKNVVTNNTNKQMSSSHKQSNPPDSESKSALSDRTTTQETNNNTVKDEALAPDASLVGALNKTLWSCDQCDKQYSDQSNLCRHRRTSHPDHPLVMSNRFKDSRLLSSDGDKEDIQPRIVLKISTVGKTRNSRKTRLVTTVEDEPKKKKNKKDTPWVLGDSVPPMKKEEFTEIKGRPDNGECNQTNDEMNSNCVVDVNRKTFTTVNDNPNLVDCNQEEDESNLNMKVNRLEATSIHLFQTAKSPSTPPPVLWNFLLALLRSRKIKHLNLVKWTSVSDLIFRIVSPDHLASMWGRVRGDSEMEWRKLRGTLYYYTEMGLVTPTGKDYEFQLLKMPARLKEEVLKPLPGPGRPVNESDQAGAW